MLPIRTVHPTLTPFTQPTPPFSHIKQNPAHGGVLFLIFDALLQLFEALFFHNRTMVELFKALFFNNRTMLQLFQALFFRNRTMVELFKALFFRNRTMVELFEALFLLQLTTWRVFNAWFLRQLANGGGRLGNWWKCMEVDFEELNKLVLRCWKIEREVVVLAKENNG